MSISYLFSEFYHVFTVFFLFHFQFFNFLLFFTLRSVPVTAVDFSGSIVDDISSNTYTSSNTITSMSGSASKCSHCQLTIWNPSKYHTSLVKQIRDQDISAFIFFENPHRVKLLSTLDEWQGIDVFEIAKCTNNRPLTVITWAILEKRELFQKFSIDKRKMLLFLLHLEDTYHDYQYHNRLHAADVAHSVHVLLNTPTIKTAFSDLEVLAAIIAAVSHDADHPGANNNYHIKTNSDLAVLYNDTSILENHHLAVTFKIMQLEGCDALPSALGKYTSQRWHQFRRMVIDLVHT